MKPARGSLDVARLYRVGSLTDWPLAVIEPAHQPRRADWTPWIVGAAVVVGLGIVWRVL